MATLRALPLTPEGYAAYGDVISARPDVKPASANLGSAARYNFLAPLENLRPKTAAPNLCVFRCQPLLKAPARTFAVTLLERHPYSTQAFIPMAGVERFLVLVSLGGTAPDLTTLRAFIATGGQGITYRPGVWHHPLVAIDRPSDFTCLIWEDGGAGDCDVVPLATAPVVEV